MAYATVAVVLRHLFARASSTSPLRHWGTSARRFLTRAEGLSRAPDEASLKLALIGAFHAAEFALYEVMTRPGIEVPIHRGKGGTETIGMGEAMGQLRARLEGLGLLGAGRDLPRAAQMRELKTDRDAVVHRNAEVGADRVRHHVEATRVFVTHLLTLTTP